MPVFVDLCFKFYSLHQIHPFSFPTFPRPWACHRYDCLATPTTALSDYMPACPSNKLVWKPLSHPAKACPPPTRTQGSRRPYPVHSPRSAACADRAVGVVRHSRTGRRKEQLAAMGHGPTDHVALDVENHRQRGNGRAQRLAGLSDNAQRQRIALPRQGHLLPADARYCVYGGRFTTLRRCISARQPGPAHESLHTAGGTAGADRARSIQRGVANLAGRIVHAAVDLAVGDDGGPTPVPTMT